MIELDRRNPRLTDLVPPTPIGGLLNIERPFILICSGSRDGHGDPQLRRPPLSRGPIEISGTIGFLMKRFRLTN